MISRVPVLSSSIRVSAIFWFSASDSGVVPRRTLNAPGLDVRHQTFTELSVTWPNMGPWVSRMGSPWDEPSAAKGDSKLPIRKRTDDR